MFFAEHLDFLVYLDKKIENQINYHYTFFAIYF